MQSLAENRAIPGIVEKIHKHIVDEARPLPMLAHLLPDQIPLHLDSMMVAIRGIYLQKTEINRKRKRNWSELILLNLNSIHEEKSIGHTRKLNQLIELYKRFKCSTIKILKMTFPFSSRKIVNILRRKVCCLFIRRKMGEIRKRKQNQNITHFYMVH